MPTPDSPAADPSPELPRDDRVLPITRVVSAAVVPVLSAAFVILFLFPGRTRQLWAWTINSPMSAMFMGGGYASGAVFFARAARSRQWHHLGAGVVATTGFATLLGVATVLHWSEFNHDHVSFWAWLALYTSTPLLLPLLWLRNRRFDPGVPGPDERLVPRGLARVMAGIGAAQLAFALLLFFRPSLFLSEWPWPLTTVSARSLAGFATFPAITYLAFGFERRWSALRVPFETAILGLAMVGLAGLRAADEFTDPARAWAWRVGLVATLVFLVMVWLRMGRRRTLPTGPTGPEGPAGSGPVKNEPAGASQ